MTLAHGIAYLGALLAEKDTNAYLQAGDISHLFYGSSVDPASFVRAFVQKHGALPTHDTVFSHTQVELPPVPEPSSYYLELLRIRHKEVALQNLMKKAASLFVDNKNPTRGDEAERILLAGLSALRVQQNSDKVTDQTGAYDLVMAAYAAQANGLGGIPLGWPSLDKMSGGVNVGDFISIVGRPGAGKSWMMLHSAYNGWKRDAIANMKSQRSKPKNRLFISMEMKKLEVWGRISSMQASVPAKDIKTANLSTKLMNDLKNGMIAMADYPGRFVVVDGNLAANVSDIESWVQQFQPDMVYVDGAYLLMHPTERDRFRRVAENAELMKKNIASRCPTITSWQFKRPDKKGKKQSAEDEGGDVSMDDIGYSDVIGQISSIALGMTGQKSAETAKKRRIQIIKGRNGEEGGFDVNYDFKTMNFGEYEEEKLSELVVE